MDKGRATRPDIELGVCGEHGGDPESITKCERIGLDAPFRVPVARLAAAQAVLTGPERDESRRPNNRAGSPTRAASGCRRRVGAPPPQLNALRAVHDRAGLGRRGARGASSPSPFPAAEAEGSDWPSTWPRPTLMARSRRGGTLGSGPTAPVLAMCGRRSRSSALRRRRLPSTSVTTPAPPSSRS